MNELKKKKGQIAKNLSFNFKSLKVWKKIFKRT